MYDIIVAGGGPAGLTAALYAARAGRSVLVLEQTAPGGQIVYSPLVENYPGLPGMSGAQFSQQLADQVEALGVELEYAAVRGFHPGQGGYVVDTEDGERMGRALVLAPGADHRHLGLPGEEALIGQGVSYCAVCDGPFYRGKSVAVVGGGDTALQDALFLSGVCQQVTLVHRREQFRGEYRLVRRLEERSNVEFLLGAGEFSAEGWGFCRAGPAPGRRRGTPGARGGRRVYRCGAAAGDRTIFQPGGVESRGLFCRWRGLPHQAAWGVCSRRQPG